MADGWCLCVICRSLLSPVLPKKPAKDWRAFLVRRLKRNWNQVMDWLYKAEALGECG